MAKEREFEEHPYHPRDMKLPGFVPGFLSESTIITYCSISALLAVSITWILSGIPGWFHRISKVDRLLMCWWILAGLTHMILEGYLVFSPDFYKKTTPHYLAEAWKEYSKGDSRYVGRDSVIIAISGTMAVIEGPACLLAMYAIATRKSYSYILQFALSIAHVYMTSVYFITSFLDGDDFAVNTFYYFWYYIFVNGWFILIPSIISIRCWNSICAACGEQKQKKTKI